MDAVESRLSVEEVGPPEMFKVVDACKRFEEDTEAASLAAALWHAERYGRMTADKIRFVEHDVRFGKQSTKTSNFEKDAYNFARLAFNGWRALRG